MIGYVTDKPTAEAILAEQRAVMESHGQANYWSTGALPIYSGDHAGSMFIPASEAVLTTPLRKGLTPIDFPETKALIEQLGGLDARQEVSPEDLINPDQEP